MNYTIQWNGKTLTGQDLTVALKHSFAQWCEAHALMNAAAMGTRHYTALLAKFCSCRVYWNTIVHECVADTLSGTEGDREFNRRVWSCPVATMDDSEFDEMLREKRKNQSSDYIVAMDLIWTRSNPKATGALDGSQAPKVEVEPTHNS